MPKAYYIVITMIVEKHHLIFEIGGIEILQVLNQPQYREGKTIPPNEVRESQQSKPFQC